MQTDNRIFDDFARMASGAMNALTGLKTEVEAMVRQQFETFVSSMNLVTREEFEVVRELAAKARDEQEALALRLAEAEQAIAALRGDGAGKRKSPPKS
ncbi:MAG TPA: accessory factor UbiK family protein [Rhodospirillaceae bacterium]|nr:accessory factor UbiK family protein [Rhodospirillaceae bacterium]